MSGMKINDQPDSMSIRVLVVDDEALLAIDIAQQLTDAGFEVVGPAASVTKALRLSGRWGAISRSWTSISATRPLSRSHASYSAAARHLYSFQAFRESSCRPGSTVRRCFQNPSIRMIS